MKFIEDIMHALSPEEISTEEIAQETEELLREGLDDDERVPGVEVSLSREGQQGGAQEYDIRISANELAENRDERFQDNILDALFDEEKKEEGSETDLLSHFFALEQQTAHERERHYTSGDIAQAIRQRVEESPELRQKPRITVLVELPREKAEEKKETGASEGVQGERKIYDHEKELIRSILDGQEPPEDLKSKALISLLIESPLKKHLKRIGVNKYSYEATRFIAAVADIFNESDMEDLLDEWKTTRGKKDSGAYKKFIEYIGEKLTHEKSLSMPQNMEDLHAFLRQAP